MPEADKRMVCPGCGAPISIEDKICAYCGRKLTIVATNASQLRRDTYRESQEFLKQLHSNLRNTDKDPKVTLALGFSLFDNGQFKEASDKFSLALSLGILDPNALFYKAIAIYKSQKPYQIKIPKAKEIIQLLDEALELDANPRYLYCKSKIVKQLFEQRFIKYPQNSQALEDESIALGLSSADALDMDELLKG